MNTQALVLAGGASKRMQPLTVDKNTLDFLGQAVIEYNLKDLSRAGVKDVVVVTNPQNHERIKALNKKFGLRIKCVKQKQAGGMGEAVLLAQKLIKGPVLIINGSDVLDKITFKQFLAQAKKQEYALGAVESEKFRYGGWFKTDGKQVMGVVEKPEPGSRPSNYFKIVLDYFYDPQPFFKILKNTKSKKDDVYEVALSKLIRTQKVRLLPQKTYFTQLKYPWQILSTMQTFFDKRFSKRVSKKSSISKRAVVRGPVIIEKGVRLFEGATVVGPAYLGEGVIVGNNAMVRHSIVGPHSVVGFNSEVVRSYVGPHCWFHSNYIGDSILMGNVSFGAGAVIANLRLDEGEIMIKKGSQKIPTGLNKLGAIIDTNVRVGVNASIMPGRLIGQGCLVGPGVTLTQDLSANTRCIAKQKLIVGDQKLDFNLEKRQGFKKQVESKG